MKTLMNKPLWEESSEVEVVEKESENHSLVLYNDDVNTFDFVTECLIKICKHSQIQAEQCTLLVHYKGRCNVKSGNYKTLEPMCTALLDRGLSAEIE